MVSGRLVMLQHRSEFLRVRNGLRWATEAFVVEAKPREGATFPTVIPAEVSRCGLTVTKQIGAAVTRNRVRRRLRDALRQVVPTHARPGFDYVVIAREKARTVVFADLVASLGTAFRNLHLGKSQRRSRPGRSDKVADA